MGLVVALSTSLGAMSTLRRTPVYAAIGAIGVSVLLWTLAWTGMAGRYLPDSAREGMALLAMRFVLIEASMLMGCLGAFLYRWHKSRAPLSPH